MYNSKEVYQEDLSLRSIPAAFEEAWAHSGWEHCPKFWFTQLLFSEGAADQNTAVGCCLFAHQVYPWHLFSAQVFIWLHGAPVVCCGYIVLQSRTAPEGPAAGRAPSVWSSHTDGWDKAMSLNLLCLTKAGSLTQSQYTQCLAEFTLGRTFISCSVCNSP